MNWRLCLTGMDSCLCFNSRSIGLLRILRIVQEGVVLLIRLWRLYPYFGSSININEWLKMIEVYWICTTRNYSM
ncbi:hypothetical protein EYC84_004188 [Monilinia fructicola]|uniref:Uncharacterized protein n=1 Tax=Monilinia fructicola TaxID=38448 RepID=A0A5M9JZI4_MONFR|nr:hypothetical protein EYC84_004188 [Monilinia fructicola]